VEERRFEPFQCAEEDGGGAWGGEGLSPFERFGEGARGAGWAGIRPVFTLTVPLRGTALRCSRQGGAGELASRPSAAALEQPRQV